MPHQSDRKFFGGEVPEELSDRIDRWIELHGDSKKRQLAGMLAEFFLALPEPLQGYLLIAPGAMADDVSRAIGAQRVGEPEEREHPRELIERLRSVAAAMTEAEYRILSPEEQAVVDQIRRELGPTAGDEMRGVVERGVARAEKQRGKPGRKTRAGG